MPVYCALSHVSTLSLCLGDSNCSVALLSYTVVFPQTPIGTLNTHSKPPDLRPLLTAPSSQPQITPPAHTSQLTPPSSHPHLTPQLTTPKFSPPSSPPPPSGDLFCVEKQQLGDGPGILYSIAETCERCACDGQGSKFCSKDYACKFDLFQQSLSLLYCYCT